MIVFKVVEKKTRWCSNIMIFKVESWMGDCYKEDIWEFVKTQRQYFPRYLKGRRVKAVEGTAGILCFENKRNATAFGQSCGEVSWKIIKVKGIGKPSRMIRVKRGMGTWPHWIAAAMETIPAPAGTIAFNEVEVLE